ncbi:acyl-CoA dehydrogenase family protein [Marinitenerispora sediminis]|uniref:acyl-CoA oxidase n=1 Tax=Marinitenerispora sediminis TaxID=1931232 RepID=A0A368T9V6_9ACTN|nr:acyl-CoA dehydrogenase [Marinitenerispora sediminis]RCV56838.1 acyl-CoA oxidase [Marinitenerispora sediminis]RCV59013.1 acyl-CoA oxidase [Marinitenerispora sediminis]RCV61547.1 acyl-CoA oxidase [Marinitenerispora sediminis]
MAITTEPDRIDVEALRTLLDGRWAHVRRLARDTLRGELFAPVYGLDMAAHRERVARQLAALAETEIPSYGFPASVGGRDDVGASMVAFEMLVCDLSLMVKVGVQWGLFGGAVQSLGTEPHHRAYLAKIMSVELPGCFAMTETGHGSDVQRLRTTAEYDRAAEEFVVTTPDEAARKDYIGNAARDGRMAVVFAQLVTRGERHGVHALLVPIRDEAGRPLPGVRIEDCGPKAGLNGVDNGRLWFDRVRVPRAALLNRYGDVDADGTYRSPIANPNRRFFTMLGTLVRGRISVAGGANSAAKAALAIAVRYADARRQFERPGGEGPASEVPLLDYLAHQRRLLPALATSYALHFAQEELVSTLHDGWTGTPLDEHRQRELEARAAGLKAVATWHTTRTVQECREACGGAGYLAENRLPQLKADSDVYTTFEGDNTVLLQLVAKGLLTNYREEFGSLDAFGMARFAAGQFVGAVIERTAARALIDRLVGAAPGRGEEADLYDRAWQYRLLEDRERHVVEGLARRLRGAGSDPATAFAAFNDAQDHVLKAGRAHVDRVVLEAFIAAIDRCVNPDARWVLDRLCDLYVLSLVEADRAWFLEHGRLTPARAKAVTAAVNSLCRRLRPHAAALIDAFGLPDAWLAAPIALGAEVDRRRGG